MPLKGVYTLAGRNDFSMKLNYNILTLEEKKYVGTWLTTVQMAHCFYRALSIAVGNGVGRGWMSVLSSGGSQGYQTGSVT